MNNKKRITLIVICAVLIVAIIASMGLLMFKSCESKQAHADYISDIVNGTNVFVNFNQIITNPTFTATQSGVVSIGSYFNLILNHYYYFKTDMTSYQFTNNVDNGFDAVGVFLYDNATTNTTYYIYNMDSVSGTTYHANLIDLTQMFGENIPTTEQANSLFKAPYYNYNAGTTISYLGLDSYSQGYNDAVGSFEYKVANSNFVNSVQSVSMNGYKGTASVYNINYLRINHVNDTDYTTCYVPFNFTVNATTHVSFNGRFSHNDGNNSLTFKVAYMDMGSNTLKDITTFKASGGNSSTPVGFQFDAPQDLSGIYIIFMDQGFDFFIYNCVLSILTTNATGAIQTAHDQGYAQAKYYYESQYAVGGDLYNEIYQKGVLDAESGNKVFQDAWQFMGTAFSGLGDLLTVEFFPGLPIGIFVALPLLLGLIYFIVKLVKGGS